MTTTLQSLFTLFFILLFSTSFLISQDHSIEWVKQTTSSSGKSTKDIITDASGNVYVTGSFRGTTDFDYGPGISNLTSTGETDIFIQKFDSNGNSLWVKQIGGIDFDIGTSIDLDANNNVYITGFFRDTLDFDPGPGIHILEAADMSSTPDDLFILKLDTDGNFIWVKHIGGPGRERGERITIDPNGNVFTTGIFSSTVDFDPGPGVFNLTTPTSGGVWGGGSGTFVQKLDSNGDLIWAKAYFGSGESIVTDANGNSYITSRFVNTGDFDPGPGVTNLTSQGDLDIAIVKLDSNGDFVWARRIGGTGKEFSNKIIIDGSGDLYLQGVFENTVDFDLGTGVNNLTASTGDPDPFLFKDVFILIY